MNELLVILVAIATAPLFVHAAALRSAHRNATARSPVRRDDTLPSS